MRLYKNIYSCIYNMDICPNDITIDNGILKKNNYKVIASDFVNFFYTTWNTQPANLFSVLNDYSKLCFKDNIHRGMFILSFFHDIKNGEPFSITHSWWNALESGSRRIDILVTGNVMKGLVKYNFVQQFTLAHNDSWKIHNSILNIF
jgi:hypothetical protein